MCGIFGVLGSRMGEHVAQHAESILRRLQHRGPDDRGCTWVKADGSADAGAAPSAVAGALLHTRLAVIDLSHAAAQPFSSADGRIHLVYNGEIYNYLELREALERASEMRFRTNGDTEVLLAAMERWGEAALARLTGMFAFALYDAHERVLTLARDPFGIKPLFYVARDDGFAFASELKAMLDLPGVSRVVDAQQVHDYLVWNTTDAGERTFYRDVRRLEPGHLMRVDHRGRIIDGPRPYITFSIQPAAEMTAGEAIERVRETFLDNLRFHLRSDVRVGCALSGGIDSSAIVCGLRHIGGSDLAIDCFSHIVDDAAIGEERWVDLVGEASGARLHKVRPAAEEMARDLDDLILTQDEPFGSTSIYAQYRVFQLARREGVTVMLDGQGADELFAGYLYFVAGRLATLIAHGDAGGVLRQMRAAMRQPGARPWRGLLRAAWLLAQPLARSMSASRSRQLRRGDRPWLNAAWFASHDVATRMQQPVLEGDFLRGLLLSAVQTTSLPALLRYEDRNSMAFSVESRVPFLTADFARLALSLPEPLILSQGGRTKWVFREAMRGIVPDAILDRRDKIGFATPESRWLTALRDWVERVLKSDVTRHILPLNGSAVRERVGAVLDGAAKGGAYDQRVWRWLNLVRWTELTGARYD